MFSPSTIEHLVVSAVFSKAAAYIVAAVATHFALVKAKVHAAEREAVSLIKSKFDEAVTAIHAEAEEDQMVVKATLARMEADIRKIF